MVGACVELPIMSELAHWPSMRMFILGAKAEESVVRLLLRRAVLQGYDMGLRDPFLFRLVPSVVEQLGDSLPRSYERLLDPSGRQ